MSQPAPAPGTGPHRRAPVRDAEARLAGWFDARGWRVQAFQREAWRAWRVGASGLVHAATGSGKTLAVWGGALVEAMRTGDVAAPDGRRARQGPRLRHLWITPLRALAADTAQSLALPAQALELGWNIGLRTGDAGSAARRRAREGRDEVLVTTPESLALMLSYPEHPASFAALQSVVVDEWHELLGCKRGVLLQLALARLRALRPGLRCWGLSATLGNLDEAMAALLPGVADRRLIRGAAAPRVRVDTALPRGGERFPFAGHLGLQQLPRVVEACAGARSTLLFTNTRSQAELWHRALASVWPHAPETLALHHGSLDADLRRAAEDGLREGRLRCVVATSSLDLGVDFGPVEQVVQVGSPKGLARLLQRAGRSGHRPGADSRVLGVPTHALELVEYAAARDGLAAGRIEPRRPPTGCLDVLAQHLVTRALGGGFTRAEALAEARATHAFAGIDEASFDRILDFVVRGGDALEHYPDYRRVVEREGRYLLEDRRQALRHRLSVGTIASDGAVEVRWLKGGRLGSLEESFAARLKPGDRFHFAGRALEFVRLRDMQVQVRRASRAAGAVPRWMGGQMSLSGELSDAVLARLEQAAGAGHGLAPSVEMDAAAGLLALQQRLSALPARDRLLVECLDEKRGSQLFLYPFAGRQLHEGLAALLAARLAARGPVGFSFAVSDLGLVLAADRRLDLGQDGLHEALAAPVALEELGATINLAELARRRFRGIARVAGLLPPSLPGRAPRSLRSLQASASLLFDVLREHDPGHLLLERAEREVLESELQLDRLETLRARLAAQPLDLRRIATLTPFAFPLWAERQRGRLSSEDWTTRVRRAAERLEARWS